MRSYSFCDLHLIIERVAAFSLKRGNSKFYTGGSTGVGDRDA